MTIRERGDGFSPHIKKKSHKNLPKGIEVLEIPGGDNQSDAEPPKKKKSGIFKKIKSGFGKIFGGKKNDSSKKDSIKEIVEDSLKDEAKS